MISTNKFGGTPYPIQQVPNGYASTPTRILYLFVQYTITNNRITSPVYGANSGIYLMGAGFPQVIANLVGGQYPSNPHIPLPGDCGGGMLPLGTIPILPT